MVSPPPPVSATTSGRLTARRSANRPWLSSTTTVSVAGGNALATTTRRVLARTAHAWPSTRIRSPPRLMTVRGDSICTCAVAVTASKLQLDFAATGRPGAETAAMTPTTADAPVMALADGPASAVDDDALARDGARSLGG